MLFNGACKGLKFVWLRRILGDSLTDKKWGQSKGKEVPKGRQFVLVRR